MPELSSTWDVVLQILGTLAALVVVLVLAWLLLRWMNRRVPGLGNGNSRIVQVLDRVSLGRNSSILLLRVRDKVMLVAVTEHAVEKLCEFDDPNGEITAEKAQDFVSFSDALKDAAKRLRKPGGKDGGGDDEG